MKINKTWNIATKQKNIKHKIFFFPNHNILHHPENPTLRWYTGEQWAG
jgi:hypothetical protein